MMAKNNHAIVLTENQQMVLNGFLRRAGVGNFSISLSSGAEDGENFGGIIIEADVVWTNGNKESTSHYILKCAPSSEILQRLLPVQSSLLIEIYVYSKILQEFNIIQGEYNIETPFDCFPVYYASLAAAHDKMIVLQNVKALNYRHCDRAQPLDYPHILFVVKEYARLHALSYVIKHYKPALFEEFERNTVHHSSYDCDSYEGIAMCRQHRLGHALKALKSIDDTALFEKFSYFVQNVMSITTKLLNSKKEHRVISHIDCGIPNLLFKYDPTSGDLLSTCMVDWQHSRLESPAVDLVTFILSAASKATRERYDELIMEYHKTFCSFMREFGCDGEKMLPFDILQRELKTYGLLGLTMAIMLIYLYSTIDQKVPDVLRTESSKEEFGFLYNLQNREKFDTRVREAICDFGRFGYNFE
ncbi:hypothetical protein PPYR_07299 [Photinus pyralis]|uniref:CHK kinase-like domain-containing protein n=3 Tax=Photinus pyralis TaxID=7054 RepID=A0A5N4AQ12_PHOPY|nr:uncharacterized protein LOC116168738 [Photinus pyralis]XP_031340565.1 uncharacterized protein LOC116168738 [Photinus pyralis]KAB0799419.1 hypothetical protein PPYR_07299 [Photinus pyralis]